MPTSIVWSVALALIVLSLVSLSSAMPSTFRYIETPGGTRHFIEDESMFGNDNLDPNDLEAAESAQYGYSSYGKHFGRSGRSLGYPSFGLNSLGSLGSSFGRLHSGTGLGLGGQYRSIGHLGNLRSFSHLNGLSSLGGLNNFGSFGSLGHFGGGGFRSFKG